MRVFVNGWQLGVAGVVQEMVDVTLALLNLVVAVVAVKVVGV